MTNHAFAKAWLVDAIRDKLRDATRPMGKDKLMAEISCIRCDLDDALRYLQDRDGVTHEPHRGWRSMALYEQRRMK